MVFRRRSNMRPINSLKHTVDLQNTIVTNTKQIDALVQVAENAVSSAATQVDIGSKVSSIFLNVQVVNSVNGAGTINNAYMYVLGNPGNNIPQADYPNVNEVGTSNMRKQIFHQEMAMLSDANDSIPITLFKGVLKIPRKFQRQGVNDRIQIVVGSAVGGPEIDACVQCIYKEFR